MTTKILGYEEYVQKLKTLKTPADIAAFVQELTVPAVESLKPEEKPEPVKANAPAPRPAATAKPQISAYLRRKQNAISPWADVVNNENESMVIDLYAKGMTTRDISNYMRNNHSVEISQPSVSTITDKVFPLVKEWQTRPLSSCYPVVYLDGLFFKVRDAGKIAPKVAYIALGINQYGQKEILGIWTSESEGSKFWMHVLSDMKNRGVEDIIFACVDGLKGFPEAIKTIFPQAEVQVCIVHQIRHTIMFIPFKDRELFCTDLKEVYGAVNEEAGMQALKEMEKKWPQYAPYLKSWIDRWQDLLPFFSYPQPIRRMIYTTNTIENLNRQFRKITKTTVIFPHDDALVKLLWLAQADITRNWKMTVRNWSEIMAQLTILFPDRVQF